MPNHTCVSPFCRVQSNLAAIVLAFEGVPRDLWGPQNKPDDRRNCWDPSTGSGQMELEGS